MIQNCIDSYSSCVEIVNIFTHIDLIQTIIYYLITRITIYLYRYETKQEYKIAEHTTDVGHRLARFLELPGSWQGEVEMPHSNYHPDFTAILPCAVCHKLESHYKPLNEKLYTLLSRDKQRKPRSEPDFPHFISNPCGTCIGK